MSEITTTCYMRNLVACIAYEFILLNCRITHNWPWRTQNWPQRPKRRRRRRGSWMDGEDERRRCTEGRKGHWQRQQTERTMVRWTDQRRRQRRRQWRRTEKTTAKTNGWQTGRDKQWIATKSLEIDQDNLHIKFLTFNVHFNSLSFEQLLSRSPPYGGIKFMELWNFRSHVLSLPGTFAPWNFRSLELSSPGTFVPESENDAELSLPNMNYLWFIVYRL